MDWTGIIATGVFLIFISAMIVMNGGVFQRKNQNWTTVIVLAAAMPVFLVVMGGFVGAILG